MKRAYSSCVVAPMHEMSPRASAGLNIWAASPDPPSLSPAPIMVWISSMNRMTSLADSASFNICRRRSSNCPRYWVPAVSAPIASSTIRRPRSTGGTRACAMRQASPSTIAVLPVPASPSSSGLDFCVRARTITICLISASRPMASPSLPLRARAVRSRPQRSRVGVG